MATVEVTDRKWDRLCQRMQEYRGALVRIELAQPDGGTRTVVQDVPLLRVVWDDKSNPCSNTMVIEAGRPNERPVRHVVVEPIHIRLKKEGEGDRYNRLQILAENGTTNVVIHPGLSPSLLKELSTG